MQLQVSIEELQQEVNYMHEKQQLMAQKALLHEASSSEVWLCAAFCVRTVIPSVHPQRRGAICLCSKQDERTCVQKSTIQQSFRGSSSAAAAAVVM